MSPHAARSLFAATCPQSGGPRSVVLALVDAWQIHFRSVARSLAGIDCRLRYSPRRHWSHGFTSWFQRDVSKTMLTRSCDSSGRNASWCLVRMHGALRRTNQTSIFSWSCRTQVRLSSRLLGFSRRAPPRGIRPPRVRGPGSEPRPRCWAHAGGTGLTGRRLGMPPIRLLGPQSLATGWWRTPPSRG